MLLTVGAEMGEGALDPFLDVSSILACDDTDVICAAMQILSLETLYAHKGACFIALSRPNLPPSCALLLLGRIAAAGVEAKWFAGDEGVIRNLRRTPREAALTDVESDLNDAIEEILARLQ
jgi:hypothetical protein